MLTRGDEIALLVEGDEGTTKHKGHRRRVSASFIVDLSEDGKIAVLKPIEHVYELGVDTRPAPKQSATSGRERRSSSPALHAESIEIDPPAHLVDEEPDPDNPYDYRHYLHVSTVDGSHSRPPSNSGTPLLAAMSYSGSPRPPKSGLEGGKGPRSNAAKAPRNSARPPKVKVQRRATSGERPRATAASETKDSFGGLIIEDSSQPTPKRQRFLTPDGGPISLHRAASTPRDLSFPGSPTGLGEEANSSELDAGSEGKDEDGDVEDLELPAPAAARRAPLTRRQSAWEPDEVEHLLAALNELPDGDEQSTVQPGEQSEAESEEE